ncbi:MULTISPECIES: hypothetical protein [Micrococcaceae]|uniref:Uncharacterized protein n=1 Tax=Arthrobacter rhombi TaxID=71253 RepID=A0A1R4F2V0_9MICC|nr:MULTISPECIES: hypothetical protein [Micrococcaceae]SJM50217.1 hypothetical protein FM101_01945 [Arthrobacter rhombi]
MSSPWSVASEDPFLSIGSRGSMLSNCSMDSVGSVMSSRGVGAGLVAVAVSGQGRHHH